MNCENCGFKHEGVYGSGRFCSLRCARAYATNCRREEINKKISLACRGKKYPNRKKVSWTQERRLRVGQKTREYVKQRQEENIRKTKELWSKGGCVGWSWARRFILEERGPKCEKCGYNKVLENERIAIEVHHMDGNRGNNTKNNLQILCLNCHFETNNFRFNGRSHSDETRKKISESSKKGHVHHKWLKDV